MKTITTQALHAAAFTGLLSLAILSPAMAADFSGSLTGVTITDSQAVNNPPVATFTYTVSGETVTFDASGSSDPDGNINEYKWDFGDGSFATGEQVQHTYTTKTNTPATLTLIDNSNGVTLAQQTIIFQETVNLAVNFQPADAAIPAGFVVDSGAAFNASQGYGWSVLPGSLGARDRNESVSLDQSYDTMIHVTPKAKWEATVPNGVYQVTVCAGDPSWPTGTPAVQVEGQAILQGEMLSVNKLWIEKSATISVVDGNITLTFTGSTDPARLNWVKIKK
jgi:PKD repeat protein